MHGSIPLVDNTQHLTSNTHHDRIDPKQVPPTNKKLFVSKSPFFMARLVGVQMNVDWIANQ
jgi:hypothetical protein